MSFVKLPRKYPTKPQHHRKKKQKPGWDDTINDLSVHRATEEEVTRRKLVATSSNMDMVKSDLMKYKLRKAQEKSAQNHRKTALLKEVLYDTSQLHDVLSKSDKMMSVVRDLFGDDPAKYKGLPHVTTAPQIPGLNSSDLPEGSVIEEPSRLDVLSEAIMNRSALNDLDSDCLSQTSDEVGVDYKPSLDYGRFQQLLAQAEDEMEREKEAGRDGRRGQHMTDKLLEELAAKLVDSRLQDDPDTPVSGAINDTQKIERTKSRLTREEQESVKTEHKQEVSSLDALRKVLNGLEKNIADFEQMTGREMAEKAEEGEPSLTGFTERLVTAVNKVSKYLKENELRLRAETTLREQLHQNLMQTRGLVDTLTNDVIATQEQYISLQSEFLRYKKDTSDQIVAIKQVLQAQGFQLQTGALSKPGQPRTSSVLTPAQSMQRPQSMLQSNKLNDPQPLQAVHRPPQQQQLMRPDVPNNPVPTQNIQRPMQQPHLVESVDASVMRPQHVPQASQQQSDTQSLPYPVSSAHASQAAGSLALPKQKDSPKSAGKQRSRLEHGEDVQSTHLQSETTGQNYQRYPLGQQHNGVILREQSMKSQPLPNNLINLTNLQKPNMGPTVVRHSMQNGLSHMSELPQQQMVQYSGLQRNHGEEHHPRGLTVHQDDGQQEMSENLERQIEELNRQHADAQDKLRRLMDQQHTVEGQFSSKSLSVSPPISPITVDSDTENRPPFLSAVYKHKQPVKQMKEIKVALPRVENIIELQNQQL